MYVFFDYFFSTVHTFMPGGVTANHLVLDYRNRCGRNTMCAVLCGEQGLIAKSKCQFKMP